MCNQVQKDVDSNNHQRLSLKPITDEHASSVHKSLPKLSNRHIEDQKLFVENRAFLATLYKICSFLELPATIVHA